MTRIISISVLALTVLSVNVLVYASLSSLNVRRLHSLPHTLALESWTTTDVDSTDAHDTPQKRYTIFDVELINQSDSISEIKTNADIVFCANSPHKFANSQGKAHVQTYVDRFYKINDVISPDLHSKPNDKVSETIPLQRISSNQNDDTMSSHSIQCSALSYIILFILSASIAFALISIAPHSTLPQNNIMSLFVFVNIITTVYSVYTEYKLPHNIAYDIGYPAIGYDIALAGYDIALAGSVLIYEKNGSSWIQTQELAPTDRFDDDWYGQHKAITKNFIFVNARETHYSDAAATNPGSVWIWNKNATGTWNVFQRLRGKTPAGWFGAGLAATDNILVAGAAKGDYVLIFDYNGSYWNEIQELNGEQTGDAFGGGVAISDDESVIIVGALSNENKGSAYVFEANGTLWVQTQKLAPNDRGNGDSFGRVVATTNDTAIISSMNNGCCGSAYIYKKNVTSGSWDEVQKLVGETSGDQFGSGLAMSNGILVIGSPWVDKLNANSGAAYIYQNNGDSWVEIQTLLPDESSSYRFGVDTAISNDVAVIGSSSGECYIFQHVVPTAAPTNAPSMASNAPSNAPSQSPTTTPSSAPTHCEDYSDISNRGSNETSFNYDYLNITEYRNSMSDNSTYFITDESNTYIMDTIKCDERNDCLIECAQRGSCIFSTFKIGGSNHNKALLSCSEAAACFGVTINNNVSVPTMNVIDIICNGVNSCAQMSIDISDFDSFNMYCVGLSACEDVNVYVDIDIALHNYTNNEGIIHCVSPNACDDIKISTNSEYTQLKMYEYSANIELDNNMGYLFAEENIFCNNHKFIKFKSWINESTESVASAILQEYEYDGSLYPCQGVIVKCGDFQCSMEYTIKPDIVDLLNSVINTDCYWVNVPMLQDISCIGECATSPTLDPTSAPTSSPTPATSNPTVDPTQEPTLFPTIDPTTGPTMSPSESPTDSPTIEPTTAPTMSPSYSPTESPSSNPSIAPTISPSNPPTFSPSLNPTYPPSSAPTFAPVSSKDFDSFIMITYILQHLNSADIDGFVQNTTKIIRFIEATIRNNYYDAQFLLYEGFMVDIESVDDIGIDGMDDTSNAKKAWMDAEELTLGAKIECDQAPENYCESVKQKTKPEKTFDDDVTADLRAYFGNSNLIFSVLNFNSLNIVCKNCSDESPDYILYALIVICGSLFAIAICAFLFNKGKFPSLPGFHRVDNAQWLSLMIFALQFWDFASDVNLSIEIWSRNDLKENILILISAIGSTVFTLLPYSANLIIASRIKSMMKRNEAAKSWFGSYSALFVVFVVLTGGCYPALAVVSSQIFGLNLLSSGLTVYELRKMSKIKVFGTVCLENVPQLIFQAIYCYAAGEISDSVKIAFFASLLSVTASTLSYLIDRDTTDIKVVHYYLYTQCETRRNAHNISTNISAGVTSTPGASAIVTASDASESPRSRLQLSEGERKEIIANRGRCQALGEALAELFRMPPKNIEIGSSTITQYGCITHIVHYLSESELTAFREELQNEQIVISAPYYTRTLYWSLQTDVNAIFIRHFQLNHDFDVKYSDKWPRTRDVKQNKKQTKPALLQQMVTQARLDVGNNVDDDDVDIDVAISQLLSRRGYRQDKIGKIVSMVKRKDRQSLDSTEGKQNEVEMVELQMDHNYEEKESVFDTAGRGSAMELTVGETELDDMLEVIRDLDQ